MAFRTRKRRRSPQYTDGEDPKRDATTASSPDVVGRDAEKESARIDKEREVWETFRDEYYEAIEQLPLTLHRQYSLLRELDEQVNAYQADILPTLRKYITLREAWSQRTTSDGSESIPAALAADMTAELAPSPLDAGTLYMTGINTLSPLTQMNGNSTGALQPDTSTKAANTHPGREAGASTETSRPSTPLIVSLERSTLPQSTRELLALIARSSEEIIRASEEKVNLAQAAYDSVDRHIRLIDQAIKEQGAAISIGIRPGTHPAPIVLPDLQVPRWCRPIRVAFSPTGDEAPEEGPLGQGDERGIALSASARHAADNQPNPRKVKKGKAPRKKSTSDEVPRDLPPLNSELATRRNTRSLKLHGPSESVGAPSGAKPTEANERRYCFCNRTSFDTMVACDGPGCAREWFHLPCVGLADAPKGKWYCVECRPKK